MSYEPSGTSPLRTSLSPLNVPKLIEILADAAGTPHTVALGRQRVAVTDVLDSWRIDDEWWREEISRRYFRLALADGRTLTVFLDLIAGTWYAQRYST